MEKDELMKKVKEMGYKNEDEFIKANIHYLPESKQKLFRTMEFIEKTLSLIKGFKKENNYKNGKSDNHL